MNEKDDELAGKKKKGTLITIIVVVAILLLWIIIFGILIRTDVGGIGTSLRPSLKNVPVLNWILPPVSDEQLSWEENYPYKDITEAVDHIKELEVELDALTQERDHLKQQVAELTAEVERLKVFEANQQAFEERVKEFDKNVVFNSQAPSIEEYKKYYEEINPTTAEDIYRLVLEQLQYDEAVKEKAKILIAMKPSKAAAALEEMTADMDFVAKVLLCMKSSESAAILDKMDQLYVAKIFRKMADMDQAKYEAIVESLH